MKRGLGRGLGSLFADYERFDDDSLQADREHIETNNAEVDKNDGVLDIDVGMIDPNVNQPRKNFDEKALKELAQSIKQHGIIQPLILQKTGDRYQIIAGERRFRAARIAGLKKVPAVIKNYSAQEISEVSIIENLQREDLNPIEAARAIDELIKAYGLTQEVVADKIGKSRPAIANTLRLLTLPEQITTLIEQGKLSAGHARTLISVEDKKKQLELANLVITKKLSVRDLEMLARKLSKPTKSTKKAEQSLELKDFANTLNKIFSTKVSIIGNDKKGRIYIDYYSADDLERIYNIINK